MSKNRAEQPVVSSTPAQSAVSPLGAPAAPPTQVEQARSMMPPTEQSAPNPLSSQREASVSAGVPSQDVGNGYDVVLLIDSSESTTHGDPGSYRKEAARLFISLLDKDDRVAIMSFEDTASMLIPLTQNTSQNQRILLNAVERMTSKSLFTNITEAVQKGLDELRSSRRNHRIIIMMSDRKLNLGSQKKDDAALAKLEQLLPELAKENIKLYTMALTADADGALLETMAKETGGYFLSADTDQDAHKMFASIYEKIKLPDTVPVLGGEFTIDSEVKNASVLVTKKPGVSIEIMDPNLKSATALKHAANLEWYESTVFDLITLHAPAPGKWHVVLGTNGDSRVYVQTNLSLKTSFSTNYICRGDTLTIDAWLEKQGNIVTEKKILENTMFSTEITGPDGKHLTLILSKTGTVNGSELAAGKFYTTIPIEVMGEYTLKILAQSRTFTREKTFLFKAAELPALPHAKLTREQAAMPAPQQEKQEISWAKILVQFVIVNLVVIALLAAGFIIGKKLTVMRKLK